MARAGWQNVVMRFLRWITDAWRRGGRLDRAVVDGKRTNQTSTAPEVETWVGPDGTPGP
jgi:hypothetical protein